LRNESIGQFTEGNAVKLEIGSGKTPTEGYLHNDINNFDGIDYVCDPWDIPLPANSLDEIIALGVMEHFRYLDFKKVLDKCFNLLKPSGVFVFDVPDLVVWCKYLVDIQLGEKCPFDEDHVLSTLYGWQRWPGDEHKSGWTKNRLETALITCGYSSIEFGVEQFTSRGLVRRRMGRPEDAHFYCAALK